MPRNRAVSGNLLPNPRVISRALFNDNSAVDSSHTHLIATFGQYLAHDITSASLATGKTSKYLKNLSKIYLKKFVL